MEAFEFSHENLIINQLAINYKCVAIIISLLFYFIGFFIKCDENEYIEERNNNFGVINLSYINR